MPKYFILKMSKENSDNVCKEKVFDQLFRSFSEELHKVLYYKYGADNDPLDIVQEAFSTLWDNCAKVTLEKARGYLYTIANNKMLNVISRRKTVLNYASQYNGSVTSNQTPQYVLESKEFDYKLKTVLESLTEDQRVTLMMNRVEGKRHKEIAELLGISTKAVEKRIYKALSIIEEQLGKKI